MDCIVQLPLPKAYFVEKCQARSDQKRIVAWVHAANAADALNWPVLAGDPLWDYRIALMRYGNRNFGKHCVVIEEVI